MRGCADLDQVGVPSVLRDTEVIIALFLRNVSLACCACTRKLHTFFVPLPKTWPGSNGQCYAP